MRRNDAGDDPIAHFGSECVFRSRWCHHHQSSRVVIGYAASGDDDDTRGVMMTYDDDTRHGLSLAFALRAEGPPGKNCTFLRVLASHERG